MSLLCDILAVASVLAGSSGLADQILEDCAGNVCCGGTKVLVHFVGSVPRTGCTRNQGNLEPRMSHRWGRVGRSGLAGVVGFGYLNLRVSDSGLGLSVKDR